MTGERDADAPERRPVRSFVLRQGRMSPAQQRTIADALEGWVRAAELSDVTPKMFFDDSVS